MKYLISIPLLLCLASCENLKITYDSGTGGISVESPILQDPFNVDDSK